MSKSPTTLVGYARVSTADQTTAPQRDALEAAGCIRIFEDTASGAKADRPQLAAALDFLREGDVLVVHRLDRLGRSVSHLVGLVEGLAERGIEFRSLSEGLDTTTPGGRLIFTVMAGIAQFERDLIIERTNAGLAAARARGRVGGRPTVLTPAKLDAAKAMLATGQHTMHEVAEAIGVGRSTLYRSL